MSEPALTDSDSSSEEWYEEEWEEVELWTENINEDDFLEKKELIPIASIPREVFKAMTNNEIVDYISKQGKEPFTLFYKPLLVDQACEIQQENIKGVFASFQLRRKEELYASAKAIAMVEEKENQRYRWIQTISKMPPALPLPVIQCLLKYVLLLNDPQTINNIRRLSREFKIVIESENYTRIIHYQNKQRRFYEALSAYNLVVGNHYTVFVDGVGYIYDEDKLNILHKKLNQIDLHIAHKFNQYSGYRNKDVALKRFLTYCTREIEASGENILAAIKTL